MLAPYVAGLSIDEVVNHIIELHKSLADFWSGCDGWAPTEVAEALREARLDRHASLSECLRYWAVDPAEHTLSEGQLTLGWTNLGSLIEGTLKLFLSVYSHEYQASVEAVKNKKGHVVDPGALTINPLRQFCVKTEQWGKHGTPDWDPYIETVQFRRNAIHGFNSRDIGDTRQLVDAIRRYLEFSHDIAFRLPYPDDMAFRWMYWGAQTWTLSGRALSIG